MNALSAFPALLDRLDASEAGGDALTGIAHRRASLDALAVVK